MTKNNRLYFLLIPLLLIAILLYFLSHILTPFLIAALLAYLANPLVEKLTAYKLPRIVSVVVVFLGIFTVLILLILLLIPLIQKQIVLAVEFTPTAIAWVQNQLLPWVTDFFGIEQLNIEVVKKTLTENLSKAGSVAGWLLATVLHSGAALIEIVAMLLLIPVVTFYVLRDWNIILKAIEGLLPLSIKPTIKKLIHECDTVLSAFFRGQLLVMLSLGTIYAVGLTLMGLKIGLIIGLIAGLLSLVPYLGFIVGITAASIAAFIQMGHVSAVLLVFIVFGIGQSLEGSVLTPKLVGDRIGLHPVAVIFAVLAGGTLFGFFGVLLALPVAAVIMVGLRFLHQHYRNSRLYQI